MRFNLTRPLLVILAGMLVFASVAMAVVGLQNPSFEDGLSSWTSKTVRDGTYVREVVYSGPDCASKAQVCLIDDGADEFTIQKLVYDETTGDDVPTSQDISVKTNDGSKMVRLGGPFRSARERQANGLRSEVSQTFTVDSANPILQLNFNVFTWDYTGFDDLEFRVSLTDENGETITRFNQGSFGPGGDTSFKTTGWQPAYVDLTGFGGQQVHVRISAGGTRDDILPFWAYIDAGAVAQQPVGQSTIVPPNVPGTGQPVQVNPQSDGSGQTEYLIPIGGGVSQFPSGSDQGQSFSNCMDLPISLPINAGSGTVSNVRLLLDQQSGGDRQFNMTGPTGGAGNIWSATIHCVATGDLFVSYRLTEGGESQDFLIPIGGLVLIDPSGVVYDKAAYDTARAGGQSPDQARATAAIAGATVRLQREVGSSFVNVLSGDPGISPNVNPQTTGGDGRYAWDTSAGTYRVVVNKSGYDQSIGGPVTVPPEVTDLHVPMVRPGGGSSGGSGGGGVGGGAGGGGGGAGASTGSTNANAGAKKGACATLTGKRLAKCRVDQSVAQKCGKLKAKKKAVCAKRVRAIAKCSTLKSKTNKQKSKKAACMKKAKAIGKKRKK